MGSALSIGGPRLELVSAGLPAPPYPPDARAKGWQLELDVDRLFASDSWLLLPGDVRPWFTHIFVSAWRRTPCATLPNDDELITKILDAPSALFATHRKALMRGWKEHTDGLLYHPVLTECVLRMMGKRRKDRERQNAWRDAHSIEKPTVTRDSHVSHTTGTGTGTGTGNTGTGIKPRKTKAASPVGFAEFWIPYPRKEGRKDAVVAWAKIPVAEHPAVMAGLERYVAACRGKQATYIKTPAAWLNGERWNDELADAKPVKDWV